MKKTKSKSKKINKSTVKRGAEVLSAMQDRAEDSNPEPAKAIGLSLEVQQKLSKDVKVAGVPISMVSGPHGRRVSKTVSGVTFEPRVSRTPVVAEPTFKFKVLCGSGVEVEVAGDMSHLFGVIDRYAGNVRIPLDMKRYGITATARPKGTGATAVQLKNLDQAIVDQDYHQA